MSALTAPVRNAAMAVRAAAAVELPGHQYVEKAGAELPWLLALAPHVAGFPSDHVPSARLLIALRALPIHWLGTSRAPAWADGAWRSPEEFFFHDLDHARFKIREDLLHLGFPCPDAYAPDAGGRLITFDETTGAHRLILCHAARYVSLAGPQLWRHAPERLELARFLLSRIPAAGTEELLLFEIAHEKSFPLTRPVLERELLRREHAEKIERKRAGGFYGPDAPSIGTSLDAARDRLLRELGRW